MVLVLMIILVLISSLVLDMCKNDVLLAKESPLMWFDPMQI